MDIKSNKKNKIIAFLIILYIVSGFIQFISLSQKNLIISDRNGFDEESVSNLKIATAIQPDWEITRGIGNMAIVNKSNGTQEGDLLIFHCTIDGTGQSMGVPFGWTILLPEDQSSGQTTASWYKIANASEPLSYNTSWGGGSEGYVAGIIRVTGYNRNDPFQTNATATGSGDIVNPSVNITDDSTLIIGFHGLDDNDQGNNYWDLLEPGPTVLYANTSGTGWGMCSAGMYYEIQASPGVSANRTWDIGGYEGWYAATVAINPVLFGINIISPTDNEEFGIDAPDFIVEITDSDVDTMWYTLDGGLHNYTFTTNGTINQAAWVALPNGTITLTFYANDTTGNLTSEFVNIIKSSTGQEGQPGPDNTLIIIIVSIIAGIALIGVILGILIKKGKISIKKPSFRKKL